MPAKTQGKAFLYGVDGTIANCAVQSYSEKESAANVSQVEDEQGNTITKRYDDRRREFSIDLIPNPNFLEEHLVGAKLVFGKNKDGSDRAFIIEGIDRKRENKGFARYTVSATAYEYIEPE